MVYWFRWTMVYRFRWTTYSKETSKG